MDDAPKTAIARVAAFRASWNEGEEICETWKLKAKDMDLVLEAARKPADIEGAHPLMPELRWR